MSQTTPQVPQQYLDKFSKAAGGPFDNSTEQDNERMTNAAMTNFLDDSVKMLVETFKAKDMWNDTLVLFGSDNGGPLYAGDNHPLRGDKYSEFEGGVRVSAFVSDDLIPASKRGLKSDGIAAIADTYITLCALANVDPSDPSGVAAGLPRVDGVDISPMLLAKEHVHSVDVSPRFIMPLMLLDPKDVLALDR